MSAIQNGVTPRKIVPSSTSRSTARSTKTLRPTGGVIRLISVTTSTMIANQISTASGSIPAPKSSPSISG